MAADPFARLRALRQQSGAARAAAPNPPANEENELLTRLRHMQGRRRPAHREDGRPTDNERMPESVLAERLGGDCPAPGLIRITSRHPMPAGWEGLSTLPGHAARAPESLVFLDTETTGLAGGSGTLAFLVGLLSCAHGELGLTQYLITRYAAEPAMLDAARETSEARGGAWVTYNGKSYDLPLLDTRTRLHRLGAWPGLDDHLDLMYGVRRGFGNRWPDCRLVTAESRLLGLRRVNDLPGAEAPEAWFRYLRQGDASQLIRVVEHNRQDLLSLAGLLPVVSALHADPMAYDADPLAIARHRYRVEPDRVAAFRLLRSASPTLDDEGRLQLARWARRHGESELAVTIWQELAELGHPIAIEALAKHLEHDCRDYGRALSVARRLPSTDRHAHRITRLKAKLGMAKGDQLKLPNQ